ncbi:FecCD family ABC transporter permease [Streptococcus loxodontisalivarius]|uniref:Iron complex transport system permease protein n=1 Tax=Streptococcus loxodontisalivarius TaxID=1349415 RepID=A0ABS2PQS9_9STRE|nr:iron ABC transporter permease [Streptococcus loxodontisalivarius]MBM7642406.1 iron complex transport system permease protein [Streptococcus loxodontisalivarius]
MMTKKKLLISFGLLIAVLLLIFLTSLSIGYANASFSDTLSVFFGNGSQAMNLIIFKIRLPRILAAILGGASLALSGMLLQTLTKNPLADSGILGINTGAGLVIAIMVAFLDSSSVNIISLMPFMAMLGGILTIMIVYLISRKKNHGISPTRLIITGVGVSTMLSGVMVSVISKLNDNKTDYIVSWLSGKITGDNWTVLAIFTPILIILWLLTYTRSQSLNIMNLNEQTALALGLNLQKERLISLVLSTALASLSVVLVGNITFVGLVAGHVSRRLMGSDHRISLPASMLMGMILLLIADTIGRVLLIGTGIPTGLIVSIIGAPYFLYLMTKVES